MGPVTSLYATMAWAALVMELWGTYLGNWAWASEVPWTGLTAWNPPLLVGAFYCFGDLLLTYQWKGLMILNLNGNDNK